MLPLQYPEAAPLQWKEGEDAYYLCIPTHLLCHCDDPLSVVETYVMPHAQPGDTVTIAESPLAIMQGRFRHPVWRMPERCSKPPCVLPSCDASLTVLTL